MAKLRRFPNALHTAMTRSLLRIIVCGSLNDIGRPIQVRGFRGIYVEVPIPNLRVRVITHPEYHSQAVDMNQEDTFAARIQQ